MAKIHQSTLMFYTLEDGDTLPKIAEKFYGDRSLWKQIYDANPDVIVLHPGVTVFIPFIQKNLHKQVDANKNLCLAKGK